jgi:hypothetical protein
MVHHRTSHGVRAWTQKSANALANSLIPQPRAGSPVGEGQASRETFPHTRLLGLRRAISLIQVGTKTLSQIRLLAARSVDR